MNNIPILVLEDCEITNMTISSLLSNLSPLDIHIVETKKQALNLLNSRNDFLFAFIDWHLETWTSEWIIKTILETQVWVIDIFATSSSIEQRSFQIITEWATRSCNKKDIVFEFKKIHDFIK